MNRIYDNKTLYVDCKMISECDLFTEFKRVLLEEKVNPIFYINYVRNKNNEHLGYAHMYCPTREVYNIMIGKYKDGTDRINFDDDGRRIDMSCSNMNLDVRIYPAYTSLPGPEYYHDKLCCTHYPINLDTRELKSIFDKFGGTHYTINSRRLAVIYFERDKYDALFALLMTKKILLGGQLLFFSLLKK